jgi:signal transduction histidine kinase
MRLLARHGWGNTAGVVLLVLATLVAVIGAGAIVTSHDRENAAQEAFARSVMDRAVSMANALDAADVASRESVLARFLDPGFRVWLAPHPPRPGGPRWSHGEDVEEAARDAAPEALEHDVFVRAVPGQPPPFEEGDGRRPLRPEEWRRGFYTLLIALPLDDGKWVVAAAPARPLATPPGTFAMMTLALFVLAIVTVAMVVAARMTRPLRTLGNAAEWLSRDLDAPPLPETGSREMRKAAAAFNTMQERLRGMVDDRSLMLAALSHDLRTVITRLRLRAEDIEDEVQRAKALEDLSDMEVMLKESLDAARGETSREPHQKVDLAALVKSLVDDLADAGKAVAYEGPERLVLQCRPVALRRALSNLVDNAIRYGGSADLFLRLEGGMALIEVADRGPGIPEGEREAMFRPFMRGDPSRNRATGGTGLGLGVARSILRAHGGDVTLADRPGGGLIARASLPVRDAAAG